MCTHTHTHIPVLTACGIRTLTHLLLVDHGIALLPVSCCIVTVTSRVPPRPRGVRRGPAGHVHRDQSAGNHREAPVQYPVRFSNVWFSLVFFVCFFASK